MPDYAQINASAESLARWVRFLSDLSGLSKTTLLNILMLEEYDEERFSRAVRMRVPAGEKKVCPRCHMTMRAPSLVDNGSWEGVLCATCATKLDWTGWYLESGDQEFSHEDR